jgi:threonine aldolase
MADPTFGSDNHAGAVPEVMEAVVQANAEHALPYGADPLTVRAEQLVREVFGGGVVALCQTGTGANVVALSVGLRPWESVLAAQGAHIDLDEAGAPERITGSKIETVPTPDGRLTLELLEAARRPREQHHALQRIVSITQSTEWGTVYPPAQIAAIADWAHAHGMLLHVDGARLPAAAAALGVGLEEAAPGADLISLGLTKIGAVAAEVVVARDPAIAAVLPNARKQATQLASKMRFTAAQVVALLEDERWRPYAEHQNAMAQRLADGIRDLPGVEIVQPVEVNAVFAVLPDVHALAERFGFHVWDPTRDLARLMTAWDTRPEGVDLLVREVAART